MSTRYVINKTYGLEVELMHDIEHYYTFVEKQRSKLWKKLYGLDEDLPLGADMGKIYKELTSVECRRIVKHLMEEKKLTIEYIGKHQELIKEEIIKELKDIYNERKSIIEEYFTESVYGKTFAEIESIWLDLNKYSDRLGLQKMMYHLRFRGQILTNLYALLHNAKLYQIVNISYDRSDDVSELRNLLLQTKADVRAFKYLSLLDSAEWYNTTLQYEDIVKMLSAGMIPEYGVISSMSILGSFDSNPNDVDDEDVAISKYEHLISIDLLDPYNDTNLPKDKVLRWNLKTSERLIVRTKLQEMITKREENKDILSIVIAAWCCDLIQKNQYNSGDHKDMQKLPQNNDILEAFNLRNCKISTESFKHANIIVRKIGDCSKQYTSSYSKENVNGDIELSKKIDWILKDEEIKKELEYFPRFNEHLNSIREMLNRDFF